MALRDIRIKDDKGATAVEYGLLVGLIAVVLIIAVTFLGGTVTQTFDRVRCQLTSGKTWEQPDPWDDATNYTTKDHYNLWCTLTTP